MSTSHSRSIEDLKRLQQGIHLINFRMKHEVDFEDAVIFVGSTKSGKSTLINYLIGNKLKGEKVTELFSKFSIIKADNSPGPTIGVKSTSETVFPTRWKSQQPLGLAIWDAPGFDDNRGVVQDITNAFYIYELFQNLKSAKIVLVTDINDIVQDNTRPFLTLLNSVEEILKEKMEICSNGIAIIFSKVPKEIFEVSDYKKKICKHYLEDKFMSSGLDISPNAKNLIRHIISNDGKIGFFKQASLAEVNQPITDININEGIFEAIQNTGGISEYTLKQVSPSVSERSRIFLHELREQLCSTKIFTQLQELLRKVISKNNSDFEDLSLKEVSQENLLQQTRNLKNFKKKLIEAIEPSKKRFDEKIEAIGKLDSIIKNLIDEHGLIQTAKFMKFIDHLLGLEESKYFEIKLQDILVGALSYINEFIINVKLKLNEITAAEANSESLKIVQQLKEERERLKKGMEEVNRNNADMSQKICNSLEKMIASQTEKDDKFSSFFEELKRVQGEIRQQERNEIMRAEERLREMERVAERREREREQRAEERARQRREDEERRAREQREDKREREEWDRKRIEEDARRERERQKEERKRRKEDRENSKEQQSESDNFELHIKIPNPLDILKNL